MLRRIALMPEYDRDRLERIVLEHFKLINELKMSELTSQKKEEIKKRIKVLIEERDNLIAYQFGHPVE